MAEPETERWNRRRKRHHRLPRGWKWNKAKGTYSCTRASRPIHGEWDLRIWLDSETDRWHFECPYGVDAFGGFNTAEMAALAAEEATLQATYQIQEILKRDPES